MVYKKYSVFSFPYSKKYYLLHPWKWVQTFFRNFTYAYRRAVYGWTWSDCYELYDWLLTILSQMFRHLAEYSKSYPGRVPFETPEKWEDWLNSIADVLEVCQDEPVNKYTEEFDAALDIQYKQKHEKNYSGPTISDEDLNLISQLYLEQDKENQCQQEILIKDVFNQIAEHFFDLWD